MHKIARRFGLGPPDAPSIPGMQVVDWRIVKLRSSKAVVSLAYNHSALYIVVYEDKSPPNTSQLTRYSSVADLETEIQIDSVDLTNIYPRYNAQFALYCEKSRSPVRENVHIKRTKILDLVTTKGTSAVQTPRASEITAHEASICDRLGIQPHPNIAEYLGVQVSDKLEFDFRGAPIQVPLAHNSVVGLVFKKYDCTLHELVIRRQKFDVRLCLQSVSAGIQCLHDRGIVHGDLKPHNIFVKRAAQDQFVIGDFDSAHNTGCVITFKTGDPRWSRRKRVGTDTAQEDDDWSGFRKLMEWLVVSETGRKLDDYKDIGKTSKS